MEKLPAITGWHWVKQGFALYRKQPAEISMLFLAYMFLMLAIGILPIIGQLMPIILVPAFSIAFLQACADIELGKRITPKLLLSGFRSPALPHLLKLGILHLLAATCALGASSLVDDGIFWQIMTGSMALDAKVVKDANLSLSMMVSAFVYVPAAMAFWYAAPLLAWQDMGVSKALFYSFFSVQRAGKAFLVYALAWVVLGIILPAVISVFVALLFGKTSIAVMILMPLSLILTVIMYCSFYPAYTQLFGPPPASSVSA